LSRELFDAAMLVTADWNGKQLRPTEKLVYLILADHWNQQRGYAFPSVPRLARLACIEHRACQLVLKKLESRGLIRRIPDYDPVYGQRRNRYEVLIPHSGEHPTPMNPDSPPHELSIIPRMKLDARGPRKGNHGGHDRDNTGGMHARSPKPEEERVEEPEMERKEEHAAQAPMSLAFRPGPVDPAKRIKLRYEYDHEKHRLAALLGGNNEQRGLQLAIERLGAFDEWLARKQGLVP